MRDLLALVTILFWLVIPLFWIPVHFFSLSYKRIGLKAYLLPVLLWMPLVLVVYHYRHLLLDTKMAVPVGGVLVGWALLLAGTVLHVWTARLLGIPGIIGVPEVLDAAQKELVTSGPFSRVRHPTYLAHTLLFCGVFLVTGVVSVGVAAFVDFVTVNLVIIPLEEKELSKRFGEAYRAYKEKVPNRLLPGVF